jgi:1-deoxyxylulose-5-phosphate synthase
MKTIALGTSGLVPPVIGVGCMSFGSSAWRPWVLDEPESLRLLARAADTGLTFFDTANVYSAGISEQILGKFLKSSGLRARSIVATKAFYPNGLPPNLLGLGRENIFASLDASLLRLGLDSVDLFQVHRWDDHTPIEETMQALADVVKAGKARFVGASNMRTWQLAKAQLAAQAISFRGFATMQNHYNLLYREDERDLIPFCRDQGIGLMCWSPLARGRLGRAGLDEASTRAGNDEVANTLYGPADDPILTCVADVARRHGVPPAQISLAWIIHQGVIPLVGVTKSRHIADAAAAAALTLSAADLDQLERAYTARPLAELPWSSSTIKDPRSGAAAPSTDPRSAT